MYRSETQAANTKQNRFAEKAKPPQNSTKLNGQSPDKAKDEQALRLRSAGWSYREIAGEMKVDVAMAYRRVKRALIRQRVKENQRSEDLRDLEIEKLRRIEKALLPSAFHGEADSVKLFMQIAEMRRHYYKDTPLQNAPLTHYLEERRLDDEYKQMNPEKRTLKEYADLMKCGTVTPPESTPPDDDDGDDDDVVDETKQGSYEGGENILALLKSRSKQPTSDEWTDSQIKLAKSLVEDLRELAAKVASDNGATPSPKKEGSTDPSTPPSTSRQQGVNKGSTNPSTDPSTRGQQQVPKPLENKGEIAITMK